MIVKATEIKVKDIIKDTITQNKLKINIIEKNVEEKYILFVGENLAYDDSFWLMANFDDEFEVVELKPDVHPKQISLEDLGF